MVGSDSTSEFVSWFQEHGGVLDTTSMQLADIPGQGRGAIALKNIPEGHTLFQIPRELTLSLRTSILPELFGKPSWKKHRLHEGWSGLILCMMWEESVRDSSRWSGYLRILPSTFDTPMFWRQEELDELKGTAVVDKIGRDDAERDYHDNLVPAFKSRPDLFSPEKLEEFFSLERYHVMGSRILSRSFQVEEWKKDDDEEDDHDRGNESDQQGDEEAEASINASMDSAMDVDEPSKGFGPDNTEAENEGHQDSEDEDEAEAANPADVAMVPMADMLNARFESENAKLFHEERVLKMVSTKPIKVGEQIWNTYGDLPNSDLLRRYGHVDVVPLRQPLTGEGNPADIVEIRADLVVGVVSGRSKNKVQERVSWWLEIADDDAFLLETDCEIPKELLSLVHLLLLPNPEWQKQQAKEKLPKGKLTREVMPIAIEVLQKRLAQYPTSIEEDLELLKDEKLPRNKRNAIIVRLGEKRILQCTLDRTRSLQKKTESNGTEKKRKDADSNKSTGGGKKARR